MNRNEPFTFTEHEIIKGLYTITPKLFTDFRGGYRKVYERDVYCRHGISQIFSESSEITSNKGVFRGLHYQTKDSQAKLVRVIKGTIFDIAVDLRPDSETFGQCATFLLKEGDNKAVFIPEDFAHGFLALENNTIFAYMCTGTYRPEYCGGIAWDDPQLAIDWPIKELILSEKDQHNMSVEDYRSSVIPSICSSTSDSD